jgi:hypothetical protein
VLKMLEFLWELSRVGADSFGVDSASGGLPLLIAAAFMPQPLSVSTCTTATSPLCPTEDGLDALGLSTTTLCSGQDLSIWQFFCGSLGFKSSEFGDESLVVVVLPKIPYPPTSAASREMDATSPHRNAESLRRAAPKATPQNHKLVCLISITICSLWATIFLHAHGRGLEAKFPEKCPTMVSLTEWTSEV